MPVSRISALSLAVAVLSGGLACGRAPEPAATPKAADAAPAAKVVQPGAPGAESQSLPSLAPAKGTVPTPADVAFMQGMILHHSQALAMVELLKTRSERDDMKLLGKKIEVSQTDEIKMMRGWLIDRHQPAPTPGAGHDQLLQIGGQPMKPMPGMLTDAQMQALAAAKGAAFDKLFLAGMIQHHQGALQMVEELFGSPGAAADSIIFDFASHVDADQRMEISRMRLMLNK